MAMIKTDYKLRNAKKAIDVLEKDNPELFEHVQYLLNVKDNSIKQQREDLQKYSNFFKTLNKFLPKKMTYK